MKELKKIIQVANQIDFSKQRAVLATVVKVSGSSYRRAGARMLILEDGIWYGGISGGCLEGDALRKAKHAMLQGKPRLVTYNTMEEDGRQIGVGLGCRGIIDVFIEPLIDNKPLDIFSDCIDKREASYVANLYEIDGDSNLNLGSKFKIDSEGNTFSDFNNNDLNKKLHETLNQTEVSNTFELSTEASELKFFMEIIPPVPHLVIYGGGYDVPPMIRLAKELGWKVSVICNLLTTNKSGLELADQLIHTQSKTPFKQAISDQYTAVALMSHDYQKDKGALKKLLPLPCVYIGMLGPKKRWVRMQEELSNEGVSLSEKDFQRIHAPVGLDIGAEQPESIALSILAEIQAFFNQRPGTPLKYREGPIYKRQ